MVYNCDYVSIYLLKLENTGDMLSYNERFTEFVMLKIVIFTFMLEM